MQRRSEEGGIRASVLAAPARLATCIAKIVERLQLLHGNESGLVELD
jgi:hypothetical protein